MTFKDWLRTKLNEDTPIGDLADDSVERRKWVGDCPSTLLIAMRRANACSEAEDALLDAMWRWKTEHPGGA